MTLARFLACFLVLLLIGGSWSPRALCAPVPPATTSAEAAPSPTPRAVVTPAAPGARPAIPSGRPSPGASRVARRGHQGFVTLPFTLMERGMWRDSEVGFPVAGPRPERRRSLRVFSLVDEETWKRFWRLHHEGDPPGVDFGKHVLLVVLGARASCEARVTRLEKRPDGLLLTVSSPRWPDLDMAATSRPYSVIRLDLRPGAVLPPLLAPREDPTSADFERLVRRARCLPDLPRGPLAGLDAASLERWRRGIRAAGTLLLSRARTLEARPGPHRPYALLLQASIQHRWLHDTKAASVVEEEVARQFPGTPFARLARSEMLESRRRAAQARPFQVLLETLQSQTGGPGACRRMLRIGSEFEYLSSWRPESMLLAARCFVEGARGSRDHDDVQNALFRAADIHDLYFDRRVARKIFWLCLERYPDARGATRVLRRLADIDDFLGDTVGSTGPYRRYLLRFPKSPRAPSVRLMLPASDPLRKAPRAPARGVSRPHPRPSP